MAIKLFERGEGWMLVPTDFALTFKSIQHLISRDKSNGNKTSIREISWIYWMIHPESGYKRSHKTEEEGGDRETVVKNTVFGPTSTWKPDDAVLEAMNDVHDYFVKHNELVYVLEKAELAYLRIGDFFDKIDLEETDKFGKLRYDPKILFNAVKELGPAYDKLEELRAKVIESLAEDTRQIRGGIKISKYNRG